jgi:hypothetical protein
VHQRIASAVHASLIGAVLRWRNLGKGSEGETPDFFIHPLAMCPSAVYIPC